jgi:hypothetical protein
MGRLRGRLRKLEREMDTTLVMVEHQDGTTSRFRKEHIPLMPYCTSLTRGSVTTSARSPYRQYRDGLLKRRNVL